MNADNFEEMFDEIENLYSQDMEDCLDWMASALARSFPGIGLEPFDATEWRRGLHIRIPTQCEHSVHEIETKAFELVDKLFFEKDVLIGLKITRDRMED